MKINRLAIAVLAALVVAVCSSFGTPVDDASKDIPMTTTWQKALQRIDSGNRRWVAGRAVPNPNGSTIIAMRKQTGSHDYQQTPCAVVVTCSDSRVPPEYVFDQSIIGGLFVVRIAGNVVDSTALGSIEYAVRHLGTPLIVVLGHTECGAVKATIDAVVNGTTPPGCLASIVDRIRPAVTFSGDTLTASTIANQQLVAKQIWADSKNFGKYAYLVKVQSALYNLSSGEKSPWVAAN